MSRLVARSGPLAGQSIDVERELVIGRIGADVNVGDEELSRRHAVLRPAARGIVIEDLGSTNGTFVDGRRIDAPVLLRGGETVSVGGSEFAVEGPAAAAGDATAVRPIATGDATAVRPATTKDELPPLGSIPGAGPLPRTEKRNTPLIVMSVVAVIAAAGAVYAFATRGSSSGGSGGKTNRPALAAAASNAAFLKNEVSPTLNKFSTACVKADNGKLGPGHFRFLTSACENATSTVVTFPLHKGTSGRQTVYYVITDASTRAMATKLGVNYVPKLKNAVGSSAVQKVTVKSGSIDFPATVDFHKTHVLVAGPTGFPPSKFAPPAVAAARYSPLIQMPDGTVLNAPHVANDTGQAIKVIKLDTAHDTVQYVETEGRYEGKHVHYVSFDSSNPLASSIENMTYAPGLTGVPKQGDEGLGTSARETLFAFTNGGTGASEPERQGINSAIVDRLDPHNILDETPTLPGHLHVGGIAYTPMWDVHLIQWTPQAVSAGDRVEVRSFDEVAERLAGGAAACGGGATACAKGLIQGFGGKVLRESDVIPAGVAGFLVNCPLVSIDLP